MTDPSLQEIFEGKANDDEGETPEAESEAVNDAAPEEPEGEEPESQSEASDDDKQDDSDDKASQAAGLGVALKDERAKRREAEERIDALEAQIAELAAAKPAKANNAQGDQAASGFDLPEDLDFFDDPKAALSQALGAQEKAFSERLQRLEGEFTQAITNVNAGASERYMRSQHDDFDEKVEAFKAAAKDNPMLVDGARAHPDPAWFIYDEGRKAQERDPAALRARLEAEIRAELEGGKPPAKKAKRKTPGSITDAGTGAGDQSSLDAEPSLTAILGK